jgi:hypothetical protein
VVVSQRKREGGGRVRREEVGREERGGRKGPYLVEALFDHLRVLSLIPLPFFLLLLKLPPTDPPVLLHPALTPLPSQLPCPTPASVFRTLPLLLLLSPSLLTPLAAPFGLLLGLFAPVS